MENAQSVKKTQQLKYNVGQLLPILKRIGGLHILTTYHMKHKQHGLHFLKDNKLRYEVDLFN